MARLNTQQREQIYEIVRSSISYDIRVKARIILAWNRKIKSYLIANSFDKTPDFVETVINDFKQNGIDAITTK